MTRVRQLHMMSGPPSRRGECALGQTALEHATARYCARRARVCEREAAQVEYQADEICLAWLLDSVLFEKGWEAEFAGEIVGVIGSGLFVRFDDVFEAFLPARRLPGDYFEASPLGTALTGRRGGGRFRLGDSIDVRIERIERSSGRVEVAPV